MATDDHDLSPSDSEKLVGDRYAIDFARPLTGAGAGLASFAAQDRRMDRGDLMALQARPDAPPRLHVLTALATHPPDGMLVPLAHGPMRGPDGREALFVIGQAPPGPSLAASMTRPWTETELINLLLRPAALALEALRTRRVTHRAIRPDNLFRSGPGQPIVLGSFWAAPPASLQPGLFEPPYAAMCGPAARGEGSAADDVYALGATLLVLAMGRVPLDELDDTAIIQRKLELGSFQALVGDARISPTVTDLARGMLAEDPDHRPPPALLADPASARGRRVATRPPRRAQHAFELGTRTVWDARTLAYALACEPETGVRLLRGGSVERWLRRSVGDVPLATHLEETLRRGGNGSADEPLGETMLAMRAIAILDPLAPLCWRGLAMWPDGLGPLLAADPIEPRIDEIVQSEAIATWAGSRPERCDVAAMRLDSRLHRALLRLTGWGGGKSRLRYALAPLLTCASPLLEGQAVTRLAELLPALEMVARREQIREKPIDREIAAFIAARHDQRTEVELAAVWQPKDEASGVLTLLRLFAGIQVRFTPQIRLPRLAGWLARIATPVVETWQNRDRRAAIGAGLAEITATGQLSAMAALLDDREAREADTNAADAAARSVATIDAELAGIAAGASARNAAAQRAGTEIAAVSGAIALAAAVAILVLA